MDVRGWVGVVVFGLGLLAGPALAQPTRTPLRSRPLVQRAGPQQTLVKFVDASRVRPTPAGLRSEGGSDLRELEALLGDRGITLAPVVSDPAEVEALAERARRRSGRAQPDMLGLFEVHGASLDDAAALQALGIVEFVSVSPTMTPPPVDVDPPTPGLVEFQGYLGPAPGLDVLGAWALGYRGASVRLSDVEYAWLLGHEEWNEGTMVPEPGQTPNLEALVDITDGNHGTAVAGILISGDNGYGTTGIAPDAVLGVYPELTVESGSRRADAILSAAADSSPGDVILLEMQTSEAITGQLGPAEINESVWLATRMAVDAGMVVVSAAGNGGLDLDRDELAYYRDRGDSGAIIVGAGSPITHARLGFSTYGERVDVQGWGASVFTTGYGQYAIYGDDPNQSYTATFSGTSSASPTVAGVAALVQDAVKIEGGTVLSSEQMRAVLRGTGLPQPVIEDEHIGPLPQAPAAIEAALVPPVAPPTVLITSPEPTQTQESTFSTTISVEASADTASVQLSVNGDLQPVVDDVPPFAFAEVVFPIGTWDVVAVATNIWEVEGSSEPVRLEVGYEPPEPPEPSETTGSANGSSGELVGGTDDGETTTGLPPAPEPPTTTGIEDLDSSGGDAGASSSAGGCRVGAAGGFGGLVFSMLIGAASRRRRR